MIFISIFISIFIFIFIFIVICIFIFIFVHLLLAHSWSAQPQSVPGVPNPRVSLECPTPESPWSRHVRRQEEARLQLLLEDGSPQGGQRQDSMRQEGLGPWTWSGGGFRFRRSGGSGCVQGLGLLGIYLGFLGFCSSV